MLGGPLYVVLISLAKNCCVPGRVRRRLKTIGIRGEAGADGVRRSGVAGDVGISGSINCQSGNNISCIASALLPAR